jgi:fructose-bisphosphate aldolase, class II
LIHAASLAAKHSSVPIAIHLDHCQSPELVRHAAEKLPFDSIMIDMSHYSKEENLAKTKELVEFCHQRGIATEAEPGRIEGGEDGVADTGDMDLEGLLTTVEEAGEFVDTGVDFLAPAFGNVHGEYGKAGPKLEFDR